MMPAARPSLERANLWHRASAAAGLIDAQGRVGGTVYAAMTELAARTGAVNLGQGAPGTDPDPRLVEAAARAMRAGANQYSPAQGHPDLIAAVAQYRSSPAGRIAPEEVLITVGATEAITASVLALVPAGGAVIAFEPFYDSYAAAAALAGAELLTVPLLPTAERGFAPDWAALDAALASPQAAVGAALIVNDPHNPTGTVFSAAELLRLHAAAQAADAWLITDEVYEFLTFNGRPHERLAQLVPDSQRIVSISSAGKTFNVTGWKIGWLTAPAPVRLAIQAVKQYLTFVGGAPFQPAIAQALADPSLAAANRDSLARRCDALTAPLREVAGLTVHEAQAGYFVLADFSALTDLDAAALNERLAVDCGIVGIPVAALCRPGSAAAQAYRGTLRYSFCKAPEDVAEAARRLSGLGAQLAAGLHTA